MTEGKGMQIVKVLKDHTYELDEKLLEQVLLKDEIKDLPVVVVSVAGAYRGGKSFLLNFFIRYLSSSQSARNDGSWFNINSEKLLGFHWRAGSARNTTGILLWSDPFVTTTASGVKVAVLLMDTQGTFDSKSTVRDNSTIFALSTLISSVQIYNLSMNLQEDDLQHLQLFTSYGKMVQEKDHAGKAFQILEFLIRDWPYPYDYPFGEEGGKRLLQERLAINSEQPKELQELRTHIQSCFEKVTCFLLPHPGFKVQSPHFTGNVNELESNFSVHLKALVSSLLSAEHLCPKTISGQQVKARELYNYFKSYMTLFNSDQIPNPRSIMQATAEAGLLSAASEARDIYEKGMEAACGPNQPGVPVVDVQDLHRQFINTAITAFGKKRTMASDKEVSQCAQSLNKELENRLPQYEHINLSKIQTTMKQASDVFEDVVRKVNPQKPLCLHPLDLEAVQKEAVNAATKLYDARIKRFSNKPDQTRATLLQSFIGRYVQLKMENDKNNKDAIRDIHTDFWKFIETKSVSPPISDAEFQRANVEATNAALAQFRARRNRISSYPNDAYQEDLIKTTKDTFWRLDKINHRKIEQENLRKEQERRTIEQERIKAEQERVRAEQERVAREQEIQRINQEKQRIEDERRRLELENQRLREQSSSSSSGRCVIT